MKTLKTLTLILAAATAIHPAWLELLGIDPDHGNGSVETLLTIACVLIVITLSTSIIRAGRRTR
jgi:hypothetical protein